MKVALVYSEVKREHFPTKQQYLTEKDALHDAKVIASYVKKLGATPLLYPGNVFLAEKLQRDKPDLVINLVGSVRGKEYLSSTIPGLLELMAIPFTGAGILGESLSYNKFLIMKLLQQSEVAVPRYQLFTHPEKPLDANLRFPLISKLNEIHGAVEINQDAVSEDENHLRVRLKRLIDTYQQPVLVQEFIFGREVTAIFFDGLEEETYLAEKVFSQSEEKFVFATFEHQWLSGKATFRYQKYQDERLENFVGRAFKATMMGDYGKFDIRISPSGDYFFVDANSNPAFGPKELQCALGTILDMYEVSFAEILQTLFQKHLKK